MTRSQWPTDTTEGDAQLITEALRDATPISFWLDNPGRPVARSPLDGDLECELAVVGGGFTGLWTALLAKERDPDRDVVLIEADRVGAAASGRNGGFCAASLTHGSANGRARFPQEYDRLEQLGQQNLDEISATIERYGIDCDFARVGEVTVATEPHQVDELRAETSGEFLDREAVYAQVHSPTYLAGRWERRNTALVDPARLAWGLARACEQLGVRIVEHTRVQRIDGSPLTLQTASGTVGAQRIALGTSAFPSLVRRIRLYTVPVYDYVLMTEPLSPQQLAAIGWANRQGIGDSGNQFHYYRLSADNRILWGGYDAVYYYLGRRVRATHDQRPATFGKLAGHFFHTFPQLDGLRFTHAWGGAIDTCTRFCAFYGTAHRGQVAYAAGYTGLGVGASRFGARVMLDLLAGKRTERTELKIVRSKPVPFPPEPLAYLGIQATRWSLDRADGAAGRRNLWLRSLDRLGLGFDT